VAVFIGPFFTFLYARKQAVALLREKWIAELRGALAEFIAISEDYAQQMIQARAVVKELQHKYEALTRQEAKIKLLLTSSDPKHQTLIREISGIVAVLDQSKVESPEKTRQLKLAKETLIPAAQGVLKDAWRQVLS
jgi:hypothetical protein